MTTQDLASNTQTSVHHTHGLAKTQIQNLQFLCDNAYFKAIFLAFSTY